jgi:UDP-glucose 4-epimerase
MSEVTETAADSSTARRILVTGGNGFVGRPLVRRLARDHKVCVLDNLRSGELRFADEELGTFELEQADIRDPSSVASVIDRFAPDVIIHLAAIHFIPECEHDPELAVSTNVVGTVNLLTSCPQGTRFVFASSAAVYAASNEALTEEFSDLGPDDVYGLSKLQGEHYVRYFSSKRGFASVIVRLFNVVGPGETNPHVLPEIVAQLKAGRRVLSMGNIDAQRDYLYVGDAARGFAHVATRGEVASGQVEVVNLGTGESHSVRETLERLREISAVDFEVVIDPARLRRIDRPLLRADREKALRVFAWEPQQDFDGSLRATWEAPDLSKDLERQYSPDQGG